MNLTRRVEALEAEVARLTSGTPTDVRLAAIRSEAEPFAREALHLAQRVVELTGQCRLLEKATSATMDDFQGTIDEIDNESQRRFAITGCEAIFEALWFAFDHLARFTGSEPTTPMPLPELEHLVDTFLADNSLGAQGGQP